MDHTQIESTGCRACPGRSTRRARSSHPRSRRCSAPRPSSSARIRRLRAAPGRGERRGPARGCDRLAPRRGRGQSRLGGAAAAPAQGRPAQPRQTRHPLGSPRSGPRFRRRPRAAGRCLAGDPDAVREAAALLGEAGLDDDTVMARALARRLDGIVTLDRMLVSANGRRDAVLRELSGGATASRAAFGPRRRSRTSSRPEPDHAVPAADAGEPGQCKPQHGAADRGREGALRAQRAPARACGAGGPASGSRRPGARRSDRSGGSAGAGRPRVPGRRGRARPAPGSARPPRGDPRGRGRRGIRRARLSGLARSARGRRGAGSGARRARSDAGPAGPLRASRLLPPQVRDPRAFGASRRAGASLDPGAAGARRGRARRGSGPCDPIRAVGSRRRGLMRIAGAERGCACEGGPGRGSCGRDVPAHQLWNALPRSKRALDAESAFLQNEASSG